MCFWWVGCKVTENSGDHGRKDPDIQRLYSNGHIAVGMLHSPVPSWDNHWRNPVALPSQGTLCVPGSVKKIFVITTKYVEVYLAS